MPIKIHGNEYVTVAERIQQLHNSLKEDDSVSIENEVLSHDPVVVKTTLIITRGGRASLFTGISAANPSKSIEKMSPYEVAETSSVGRSLGFAGFGSVDSIASADEMVKAAHSDPTQRPSKLLTTPTRTVEEHEEGHFCKQCNSGNLAVKISNSEKNPGREYYHCPKCNGFSHWVAKDKPNDEDGLERWVDENVEAPF